MKRYRLLIVAFIAVLSIRADANEPLWTPQQRQENRSHVTEASITETKRLDWKPPSDDTFWTEATIQIKTTVKGDFGLKKIYYLSSNEGDKRCPKLPTIVKSQSYMLYCVEQIVEGEKRLVLPLASDATLTTKVKDNEEPAPK